MQIGWRTFITWKPDVINSNCSYLMHPKCYSYATLRSFDSILYGLRSIRFYYVDFLPPHISWRCKKIFISTQLKQPSPPLSSHLLARWLCRFDSNFSQVNAIILRIVNVAFGNSDKLHWHNIDWWYKTELCYSSSSSSSSLTESNKIQ